MVKVLLFSLFDAQKVVGTDEEPVEIGAAGNSFLTATKQGTIILYEHANECVPVYTLRTVNTDILDLQYAPPTSSIITLEKESPQSAINVVRVYTQWRSPQLSSFPSSPLPITSAFSKIPSNVKDTFSSSPVTGSPLGGSGNNIGVTTVPLVFKLPIPSSIVCLAVCPITGRVCAATKTSITLWIPLKDTLNKSDTMEKILEIDALNVIKLAIYGNYFAYCTTREVKVLWLNISTTTPINKSLEFPTPKNTTASPILNSGYSNMADDEHYLEISFDSIGTPNGKSQLTSITANNLNNDPPPFEKLGPITDTDHSVVVDIDNNKNLGTTITSMILLIHRRFAIDTPLHSLHFLPEYPIVDRDSMENDTEEEDNNNNTNNNNNNNNNDNYNVNNSSSDILMRCFFSTTRQGYLYSLNISMSPSLLCSYSFTGETNQCCVSSTFLYAIAASQLETWTLRPSEQSYIENKNLTLNGLNNLTPKVINNYYNNEEENNTPQNNFEDMTPSPCLVGLQPFMSLQRIVVLNDGILLLSKISEEKPLKPTPSMGIPAKYKAVSTTPLSARGPKQGEAWSLYLLHHTPVALLYKDMISTASTYESSNPSVYYQLLLESHFLLISKYSILNYTEFFSPVKSEMDPAVALNIDVEIRNYQNLMEKSSTLLANYYLQAGHFIRAAHHYSHSTISVGDVVNLFLKRIGEDKEIGPQIFGKVSSNAPPKIETPSSFSMREGLTLFLDKVLFDPKMIHRLESEDVTLANKILTHYHTYAPHRLSTVILDSSLSAYSQSLALNLLATPSIPITLPQISVTDKNLGMVGLARSDRKIDKRLRDKDKFATALLYLDQGGFDLALVAFREIHPHNLVDFCVSNPKLLTPEDNPNDENENENSEYSDNVRSPTSPDTSLVPPLGKVLRVCAPWALLEILVRLGDVVKFNTALGMLKKAGKTSNLGSKMGLYRHPDYDLDALLAKCYLEYILLHVDWNPSSTPSSPFTCETQNLPCDTRRAGHKRKDKNGKIRVSTHGVYRGDIAPLLDSLALLYFEDVMRYQGSDTALFNSMGEGEDPSGAATVQRWATSMLSSTYSTASFGIRWRRFHRKAFLRTSEWKWLDRLPPFAQSATSPLTPTMARKARATSPPSINSPRMSSQSLSVYAINPYETDEDESFDYQYLYLRKLQGLVTICNPQVCSSLLLKITASGNTPSLSSLRLLCMPRVGSLENAVNVLVELYPEVCLDYGKHFCKTTPEWSVLLNAILRDYQVVCASNNLEKGSVYREVYESLLDYLSTNFDPATFLYLLPTNGILSYYLPFIERVFARQKAKTLVQNILGGLANENS